MSLRLSPQKHSKGTDAAALRIWAMFFLTAGVVGQGLIQNRILNLGSVSAMELLENMQADSYVMAFVTAALMCKLLEACAVPLLAFLLVEGFRRTSSFEKYLIRVAAVAVVTEIPYNLTMGSGLIDTGSRNPVFAMAICLLVLYFYNRYAAKGIRNTVLKAIITLAAFLWCVMLGIDHGICVVVMVAFLWFVREKNNYRAMFAFGGTMLCTAFNLFYICSGFASVMLHHYNEERGEQNSAFNYAFYPALLLIVGIAGRFLV